jgi:ceramide synthetase
MVIFSVALSKPWFWDPKECFSDCYGIPCYDQQASEGELFIYRLELAFYAQAIPMVFFWETKRKDMWELVAHHVATVILIGYSYYLQYVYL